MIVNQHINIQITYKSVQTQAPPSKKHLSVNPKNWLPNILDWTQIKNLVKQM